MSNEESKMTNLDKNSEFLFQLSINRLQKQMQQIDALDNKIISLSNISYALMAILVAAIAIIGAGNDEITWPYAPLAVSVISFIMIIAVSIRATSVKPWEVGPDLKEAWENSSKFKRMQMLSWAANSFRGSYENNSKKIGKKVSSCRNVNIMLIFQMISLIFALILISVY